MVFGACLGEGSYLYGLKVALTLYLPPQLAGFDFIHRAPPFLISTLGLLLSLSSHF